MSAITVVAVPALGEALLMLNGRVITTLTLDQTSALEMECYRAARSLKDAQEKQDDRLLDALLGNPVRQLGSLTTHTGDDVAARR